VDAVNPASHAKTAPEDRISMPRRLAYGAGAFVNNLLAAASGNMMIVLNLGLGMNPVLVGMLGAIPRLTDALTDPVMGYISDNADTRWGRRRPFIFSGIFLAAFLFALLWQLPDGHSEHFYFWWFLIGSILFYIGYTWWVTPWVALGYELTPDYHERTRLMGTQNFIGQLAYVVSPWFLWIMNSRTFLRNATPDPDQIGWGDRMARSVAEITVSLGNLFGNSDGEPDQITGAAGLAILVAVVTLALGLLPAIFLRERMREVAAAEREARQGLKANVREFLRGFGITLKSIPFLKLCAATFLVFNGFILISAFASYVIIYYVCAGDQEKGAYWVGQSGMVGGISTFAVVAFITWLATRIGKRRAFMIGIGVSIVGYGLKWICYNPGAPWLAVLPAPLMAFGLGTLFTLVPSMVADVVDTDELETHERREGMYGSIFWWTVKLGLSAALFGSGYLLNSTGFDVGMEGPQAERTIILLRLFDAAIPMITSVIAIWAVYKFPITEQRAYEVRQELERRRGPVTA
jgi:GPH family glycoside/pentoside/hexuronide:cation symporter